MSSIQDIARSGLLATRAGLAVTAENIANVGTDGYRRREVSTVTAAGSQATSTTLPTRGQGVRMTEVRRAFDELAAERGRNASSNLAAAEAHKNGAMAIETLMIPGDDALDGTLRDMFNRLSDLSSNPTDSVTRSMVLRAGEAVADGIVRLGDGLAVLRDDMLAEAGATAKTAEALLKDLDEVSRAMAGVATPGAMGADATHPLADRRDALLSELADLVPVAVSLSDDGRPTVRLGSAGGPILLDSRGAATLSVSALDALTLTVTTPDGALRDNRLLASGKMAGLSRSMAAVDQTVAEIDAFARDFAATFNAVHREGVDLRGDPGGDLFRLDGWRAEPAAANGGVVQIDLTPTDTSLPQDMTLVYDGAASLWRAFDGAGDPVGVGATSLTLAGVTVEISGMARDGDRIALTPVTGHASDLRMAITDPAALVAAAPVYTAAAPSNNGAASLAIATAMADLPDLTGPLRLTVSDAQAGTVTLTDPATGTELASGTLDAAGRVSVGGMDLVLTGAAFDGDMFSLIPATAQSGNGDIALRLAALQDDSSAAPGLSRKLAQVMGDVGVRAAATTRAHDTAYARAEAAERELSAIGAVDLDVEAARLLELQQGYQANAQAMSVAQSLFDALLQMF